jgi:hypothetical protein
MPPMPRARPPGLTKRQDFWKRAAPRHSRRAKLLKERKNFFFEKKHAPGPNWGSKKLLRRFAPCFTKAVLSSPQEWFITPL